MNISCVCQQVAQAPYGARFALFSDDTPQLEVFSQDLLERIFRIVEAWVGSFLFRFQSVSWFDGKRLEVIRERPSLLSYFEDAFGKERFHRAVRLARIDPQEYQNRFRVFSKEDLQAIFPRLLMMTQEDYEEILQEIVGKKTPRSSVKKEWTSLQKDFAELVEKASASSTSLLAACSKEQVRRLDALLVPISRKEACLGFSISKQPDFWTEISREYRDRYIAYAVDRLRNGRFSQDRWEIYVAKCLSRGYFASNFVLPHPKGLLVSSDDCIDEKGVYISNFVSLNRERSFQYIVFRGTGDIGSCREDLTDELGAPGIMALYSKIAALLPSSQENRQITLLGYSLGGAQAQRVALACSDKVDRLVTVSSPGIERESAALLGLAPQRRLSEISHHFDLDDFIPTVGEVHVGIGLSPEDSHIQLVAHFLEEPESRDRWCIFPRCRLREDPVNLLRQGLLGHARVPVAGMPYSVCFSNRVKADQGMIRAVLHHDEKYVDPEFERIRRRFQLASSSGFAQFVRERWKSSLVGEPV